MAEPKKETARIRILPQPAAVTTRTNVQPLLPQQATVAQTSQVVLATSSAADAFDSIPRWLCWGLFSISALIFLIQIWNYAVS
jgi:hypothetical protein